jgi:hypothetical protein
MFETAMKTLSDNPVIRKILEQETERTTQSAISARSECLARLKTLRITEAQASQKRDKAAAELAAAEAKIVKHRAELIECVNAANAAYQSRQHTEQQLISQHGEDHVTRGLQVIDLLKREQLRRIEVFEHQKYLDTIVGNTIIGRRPNPGFDSAMAERTDALKKIEAAYTELLKLVEREDLAPSQIKQRVSALLQSAGYRPSNSVEAELAH